MEKPIIKIYTDGACSGNPGKGGWGAVLLFKQHQKKISGSSKDTTNNRMELTAVIEALKTLKQDQLKTIPITVFTDSKYVMDGITKWIESWKNNGWRTADRRPVKNCDLWQSLDLECKKHQVKFQWVKGHAGDEFNEIADQLARKAID